MGMTPHQRRKRKARVFHRDGPWCFYCRRLFAYGELTLDHLIPQVRGGSDRTDNLLLACAPCNTRKGSKDVLSFICGAPVRGI